MTKKNCPPGTVRRSGKCVPFTSELLSPETTEMLEESKGYRCESWGGKKHTGLQDAKDILQFEGYILLMQTCDALGLICEETDDIVSKVITEINEKYGKNSKMVWLGTYDDVGIYYCEEDEEPDEYDIPENVAIISDLSNEGTLFLFPEKEFQGGQGK